MAIRDRDWVRGLFGQQPYVNGVKGENKKEYTLVHGSFSDTSIGGNQAINPIPQFTRYADAKSFGYFARPNPDNDTEGSQPKGSYGMGRFYGEAIDNNAHYAHFRFGTPKYIGLLSFITSMHDPDLARLTTDGMFSSVFRTIGKAVGVVGLFVVLGPAIVIPLLSGSFLAGQLLDADVSKYWFVKPQMHLYLQSVQAMLDNQLVHARLVPFWTVLNDKADATEEGSKVHEQMQSMYTALPDIWKSNGKFDVFKMINRYQILADYEARMMQKIYETSGGDPEKYNLLIESYIQDVEFNDQKRVRMEMNVKTKNGEPVSILEGITNAYINSDDYKVDTAEDKKEGTQLANMRDRYNAAHSQTSQTVALDTEPTAETLDAVDPSLLTKISDVTTNAIDSFKKSSFGTQFMAELHDGAQWVTFRVDGKGTVSDSFSNSTTAPQIESAINGISSQARSLDMNLSGGVTGIGAVDGIVKGVKDLVGGAVDVVNLSGLAGIFGKSSVDIPELWESSSAEVASESYTIHLRTPYGNDISIFQNLTTPLCFILAGCLPMATGKQTHRNPFYCEVISRGRNVIRNGIITSVSITRGAGNVGWRSDGKALGIDVTITVKDLSKVMAMPLIKDRSWFADDNMYTDYMATLGSASLQDMIYMSSKLTLNFNMWKQNMKSAWSVGTITNKFTSSGTMRFISNFVSGTARG